MIDIGPREETKHAANRSNPPCCLVSALEKMDTLEGPVEDLSGFDIDCSDVTSFPMVLTSGTAPLGGEAGCSGVSSAFLWCVTGGSVLRTCD